jgi:hypothetical protein
MAARTAVVAGTATAVSGRVARRQANKYADEDADSTQQQATAMGQGLDRPTDTLRSVAEKTSYNRAARLSGLLLEP